MRVWSVLLTLSATCLIFIADEDHPPVKAGDFTEKLALLRANDDEALEDEYAVSGCGLVRVSFKLVSVLCYCLII